MWFPLKKYNVAPVATIAEIENFLSQRCSSLLSLPSLLPLNSVFPYIATVAETRFSTTVATGAIIWKPGLSETMWCLIGFHGNDSQINDVTYGRPLGFLNVQILFKFEFLYLVSTTCTYIFQSAIQNIKGSIRWFQKFQQNRFHFNCSSYGVTQSLKCIYPREGGGGYSLYSNDRDDQSFLVL